MPPKITKIEAFKVDLPLREGSYHWSDGKSVRVFDSTVVAIHTDAGVSGYGEICPLGSAYLPAYANGARTGIAELAPHLIGLDPTELSVVNDCMDRALRGHPYVKSALDMACWDILGKVTNQPIVALLGGRYGESFPLYRAISQEDPEEMARKVSSYRTEGYTKFQLKVGGNPDTDIERVHWVSGVLGIGDVLVADANTGWTQHQLCALSVLCAMSISTSNNRAPATRMLVVGGTPRGPLSSTRSLTAWRWSLQGVRDQAMDVINLKISKVGGLTKARRIRDLCVSLGIALTIEDTWGGDITTAAIAHLAHSTPPDHLFSSTDFNSYVTVSIATGAPQRKDGRLAASHAPGLGIEPLWDVLGDPIISSA